ncbi:hypothetical protein HYW17_03610 [Candidatus Uhrbacteria bacterium]|nr:hypothetical protein [Candidatus Uhrbacteria bacterium]
MPSGEKEYALYFRRPGQDTPWHSADPLPLDVVKQVLGDENILRQWASNRLGVQSRGFCVRVVEMAAGWFKPRLNRTVGKDFFARRDVRVVPLAELHLRGQQFEERDGAIVIPPLNHSGDEEDPAEARL